MTDVNYRTDLVEAAIDALIARMQAVLPLKLNQAFARFTNKGKFSLEPPRSNAYHIDRAIEPKVLPAIFVLADRTTFNLNAQNFTDQTHPLQVVALMEDVEIERLRRKSWRYGWALRQTLHDYASDSPVINVFVTRIDYSDAFKPPESERPVQTEVNVFVNVRHLEAWE